jgi:hypothetical protein
MKHFSETNARRFAQQHWFRANGEETKALKELQVELSAFLARWAGFEGVEIEMLQDREVLPVGFRLWMCPRGAEPRGSEPVWPASFQGLAVMNCPPLHEDRIPDLLQRHPMGVLLWRGGSGIPLQVTLVLPHPHDEFAKENRLSVFSLGDGGWGLWTPAGLKLARNELVVERDLTGWLCGSEYRFDWGDPRAEALWEASLSAGATLEGLRNLADRLRLPSKKVIDDFRAWDSSLASWGDRVCEVLAKALLPVAVEEPPTLRGNGWWVSRQGSEAEYLEAGMFFVPKSEDGGMVWVLGWERRTSGPGQFQYRTLGLEKPDIRLSRDYRLHIPYEFDKFCQELLEVALPKLMVFLEENHQAWDRERARRMTRRMNG